MNKSSTIETRSDAEFLQDMQSLIQVISYNQMSGGFKALRQGFIKTAVSELIVREHFTEMEDYDRQDMLLQITNFMLVTDMIDKAMESYPNREITVQNIKAKITEYKYHEEG